MSPKDLCLKLVQAENEKSVIEILKKAGYWNSSDVWRAFNDDENNFSTIGNQSSKPDAALVEKLINSVDAMLMGEQQVREGEAIPETVGGAVEKYFGVKSGKLAYLAPSERSKLAQNIYFVATGKKTSPCYSIIDKGEGQTPKSLINTILAISKNNKRRIPFVQGQFHMGGTGALRFGGDNKFQLVISKRRPEINEDDETKDYWGFTIIRREYPEGARSSVYRYLAPEANNGVLKFTANSLPLLPGEYPKAYEQQLEYGTFIKLYEYNLKGLKSPLYFDPYYQLSSLLPGIALPIRLSERRKGYTAAGYDITLAGLKVRLENDRSEALEEGFPDSHKLKVAGEEMTIEIYAFKKNKEKNYRGGHEGVLFTINGQTHGEFPDTFFTGKAGMSYLKDSILLICDCSKFSNKAREELFMNSRDRLSKGSELYSEIYKSLKEIISQHPGLKELRMRRRQDELSERLADSKPLADLLNNALKRHPSLAFLLGAGKKLSSPFHLEKKKSKLKTYSGKKFPTFFTIKKSHSQRILERRQPLNRKTRIKFETDVVNDYFSRDELEGTFTLLLQGKEIEEYSFNLWEGIAVLNLDLPVDACEGEVLEYEAIVNDETQIDPFVNKFKIICDAPAEKSKGGEGNRTTPPDEKGDDEKDREEPSGLGLPPIEEVRKDRWEEHEFDENSALKVIDNGEGGYDFFINMDNTSLLHEIKAQSDKDAHLLQDQFKYGLTLLGMALVQGENGNTDSGNLENQESIESYVYRLTKSIAPVLIPLIDTLGNIDVLE